MKQYLEFRNHNVVIAGRLIIINKKRYEAPKDASLDKVIVLGSKVYLGKYELKKGKFKKTIRAKLLGLFK